MPPVFGPWSLSNMRLWSCAPGMPTAVTPSQNASNEISSPSKYSSTTISAPALRAMGDGVTG